MLPGCFSDWLPLARARYLRRKTSAHRDCRRRTLRQPIAAASDEAYFAEKILVPALPFVGSRRGVEPELRLAVRCTFSNACLYRTGGKNFWPSHAARTRWVCACHCRGPRRIGCSPHTRLDNPETGHVVYDSNVRYSGAQKIKNTRRSVTPQQVMAEEATKKPAEYQRAEEQMKLERRLAALKAEPVVPQNSCEPPVQNASMGEAQVAAPLAVAAVTAPAAAPVAPAAALSCKHRMRSRRYKQR